MTNYDDWTDFQVSQGVARARGYIICGPDEYTPGFKGNLPNSVWFRFNQGGHKEHKDYCNNPSDMWPIILEHNILIRPRPEIHIGKPFASDIRGIYVTTCLDNNGLLRAAAIVYLKMEEAK